MQNQSPIAMTVKLSADYLRKHWKGAACNGPNWPEAKKAEILACADKMEASRTSAAYEAALAEAHKLGMSPPLGYVSQAARAAVLYAD